ncbi:DUF2865 domain-containing protein [Xaviernesmea oryzae]|uniref:DUF2865 domain-containing protein n=1 Tax=Xaviernesmea oryzae TaxID=464029 RepID=UPI00147F2432|nr:DUF2865 domain-containing protein [Xaviernesmea oryzae]
MSLALCATSQAATLCDRLYQRLADLPEQRRDDSFTSGFTGDITRLNLELRAARADLRRLGCTSGSIVVIGGTDEASCDALNERIVTLVRDIDGMKAERLHASSHGDDEQRRRILAAIDVNRCEDKDSASALPVSASGEEGSRYSDRPQAEDALPPGSSADGLGDDGPPLRLRGRPGMGWQTEGTVRTLCVRTCDGAFFPISSQATSGDFARDAETCRQRCPGAPTALYYHALETQEAEDMVSAETGAPYRDLPTAFAYKLRDPSEPSSCGCQLSTATGPAQSQPGDPGKTRNSSMLSITTLPESETSAPSATPDSAAIHPLDTAPVNAAQAERAASPPASPSPERPYDPSRRVRQIGPSFLPAQESAIDLHHPKTSTPSPETN